MITKAKHGIVQPRLYNTLLLTEIEPTSYKIALKHSKWLEAMKAEQVTLLTNNT